MKERKDIDPKYKWNLESIIDGKDAWQTLFDSCVAQAEKVGEYQGKLSDDNTLLEYMRWQDDTYRELLKLYLYAKMHLDEDTANGEYQKMVGKIQNVFVRLSALSAFVTPEICLRSADQLLELARDPAFADYSYSFEQLAKNKEKVLSEQEERIISDVGAFSDDFAEAFNMFDNADIRFKPIIDENGKRAEMSHAGYSLYLQSPVRRVRRAAFNSMYDTFGSHNNTLAAIYGGNIKKTYFHAKQRGFDRCLDYKMYYEDVPSVVYSNLISAVHSGIPALGEYLRLRKKILGLRALHCYDLYVPMWQSCATEVAYEDAFAMVKEALSPLGEDYRNMLEHAYTDGWIDVYPTRNKRSGAYSWGMSGIPHPFVCLNHTGTMHDVFTIAHELGHAMHTHYSSLGQPYAKSDYVIFVAEVASTVNEVLLLKYLLKKETDQLQRKYLLSYYLEMFRTTVFRQTMFAEFEEQAHALVESGQPVVAETLNSIYYALNETYYPDVDNDDAIKYEWSRIPHFYRDFYVYKYATGLLSAVYIATEISRGNEKVKEGYRAFLSAGGSMPPCDILRLAGVDLEQPETMMASMSQFADTLEELKAEYER